MYQKTAAEHFAEAMTRLSKHPHPFAHAEDQPQTEQPKAPTGSAFTIAFSREAARRHHRGTRGGQTFELAGIRPGILENLAKELNVDISFLEDYDERRGSFLVDTIKAFSAAASVSEVTYFPPCPHDPGTGSARGMSDRRPGLDVRSPTGNDPACPDRGHP